MKHLIVLSAPSGAGKTTIAKAILARHPELQFSVSATTRSQRDYEQDGVDYHFLHREEFEKKIAAGALAEWEELFGNLYGTLISTIDDALRKGHKLLFDIDVRGGLSLKKKFSDETLLVFIQPPSLDELRRRLELRGTETEEVIARRIERARYEMEAGEQFDSVVINDSLEKAINAVDALLTT